MTWVIAGTTMMGDVIVLSDIQVTWRDDSGQEHYLDCLRKVFPIQPNVAVGFSGNVKSSFAVIARFEGFLSDKIEDGKHWQAQPLLDLLREFAVEEYHDSNADFALMFACVEPHESIGVARRPTICALQSPHFEYTVERRLRQVQHIGIGASAESYKRLVDRFFVSDEFIRLSSDSQYPWFMPGVLRMELNSHVAHDPVNGVSHWFHDHLVRLEGTELGTQQVQDARFDPGEMPKVVSSFLEFAEIHRAYRMNLSARA